MKNFIYLFATLVIGFCARAQNSGWMIPKYEIYDFVTESNTIYSYGNPADSPTNYYWMIQEVINPGSLGIEKMNPAVQASFNDMTNKVGMLGSAAYVNASSLATITEMNSMSNSLKAGAINGTNGAIGLTGSQGMQGVMGLQGANGSNGSTGATGADGELSIQRTRVQTDATGNYTWTFPSTFGSGVLPIMSANAEGVSTTQINIQIVSSTRSNAVFKVYSLPTQSLLGISVAVPTATQAFIDLMAIAPAP